MRRERPAGAAARVLAVCLLIPAAPRLPAAEGRAFWITRWNANDEAKVRAAIAGLRALGANTVFVQVYGDSMALFDSSLAPRSPLVAAGQDPLAADVDAVGTPDTFIFFCPERDDLRARLAAVAVEIATRYEVDGIHLDYLRFPGGAP